MRTFISAICLAALTLASPALAQTAPGANPQIDYAGFERLVSELGPVREKHRLPWAQFKARMRSGEAILLDARSAADFRRGHIKGAISLPFSEFTDARLAEVLGPDSKRPILIYCNNNFSDNIAPVVTKRLELALNIPTFINLHGYGYSNVWELADVVSIRDPKIGWVRGAS